MGLGRQIPGKKKKKNKKKLIQRARAAEGGGGGEVRIIPRRNGQGWPGPKNVWTREKRAIKAGSEVPGRLRFTAEDGKTETQALNSAASAVSWKNRTRGEAVQKLQPQNGA